MRQLVSLGLFSSGLLAATAFRHNQQHHPEKKQTELSNMQLAEKIREMVSNEFDRRALTVRYYVRHEKDKFTQEDVESFAREAVRHGNANSLNELALAFPEVVNAQMVDKLNREGCCSPGKFAYYLKELDAGKTLAPSLQLFFEDKSSLGVTKFFDPVRHHTRIQSYLKHLKRSGEEGAFFIRGGERFDDINYIRLSIVNVDGELMAKPDSDQANILTKNRDLLSEAGLDELIPISQTSAKFNGP